VDNNIDHVVGQHHYIGDTGFSCLYSGPPNSECTTSAYAYSIPQVTEDANSVYSGGYLMCHEDAVLASQPRKAGVGEESVTANGGGSVSTCSLCACNLSITFSNGSFVWPPHTIFSDSNPMGVDCPAAYSFSAGSPIILALDKTQGYRLTSARDGVQFRMAGKMTHIAWTEAGGQNAFLVLDRNGNGKIDGGDELFGNYTEQPACPKERQHCENGYRALAVFDSNRDGIIDHNDAVWSKLRLWLDLNHDGISQPEELFQLESLGVFSLGLHYDAEDKRDRHGNTFRYRGAVNPSEQDGQSAVPKFNYDVFLREAN
jgi:hypothetical protein